jgi:deoxyribodipyrimidine photo-lyase
MTQDIAICWLRRDLRLTDNTALTKALSSGLTVLPIFIFDTDILNKLDNPKDARVSFIHATLHQINEELKKHGTSLSVFYDKPVNVFKQLIHKYSIKKVFANHDYEEYGIVRDNQIHSLLASKQIEFETHKDIVVFEKNEVTKDDGLPYTVFTPYSKKWKLKYAAQPPVIQNLSNKNNQWYQQTTQVIPSLEEMGFSPSNQYFPPSHCPDQILELYSKQRDIPSIHGTSKLGLHLRFGTISVRMLAKNAASISESFLNELIWRDFYHMILFHFPHINKGLAFKPAYDKINWRNNEAEFEKWCKGETGYPIVDAGMRELNATGFMHNRVRMIVASFLCKHLLIDWRWGESYFAKQLLDFDFAANNGGWQWAAGSGCDAAPYFRIFNPYLQTQKFDPKAIYIKKWVPEYDQLTYTKPVVAHEMARKRCLEVYKAALA